MADFKTELKKQQLALKYHDTQISLIDLSERLTRELKFFGELKMNPEKLAKMSPTQSIKFLDRILQSLKKTHAVASAFSQSHKKLFDFANELFERLPDKKDTE